MKVVLSAIDRGGDHTLHHDLNFKDERYETLHPIVSLPLDHSAYERKAR